MTAHSPSRTEAHSETHLDELLARCAFPVPDEAAGASASVETPTLRCAVSGGADSAALLLLAHRHAQRHGLVAAAVHVDHQLRPDSHLDANHIRCLTDRLGVELAVVTLAVEPGGNLEARARDARHEAIGDDTLLGHTADDRAETLLLQLMRGGALDALASMRPDRRPLLGLRRAETAEVCRLAGYEPLDDPMNADKRFWRTRVRHEAIPLLEEIAGRDVVALLNRAAEVAADEATLLDGLAAAIDPTDAAALAAAPEALARRAVRSWLADPYPPSAAAVERVLEVARGTYRATEIAPNVRVARTAGRLRKEQPPPTDRASTAPEP